jgi:hypothetical protein
LPGSAWFYSVSIGLFNNLVRRAGVQFPKLALINIKHSTLQRV